MIKQGFTHGDFKDNPDDEYAYSWHNVTTAPEKVGLERVGEHEWVEPDYSFDTLIVLRDPDAKVFYSLSDAGCSCPSPFEDYTSHESMPPPKSADSTIAEIEENYLARVSNEWGRDRTYSPVDLIEAIRKANG